MVAPIDGDRIDAVGPLRAFVDPAPENLHLRRGEAAILGRHHQAFVEAGDEAEQRALRALPWNNIRGVLDTSGEGVGLAIEPQTGFLLFRPMAGIAVALEDWTDVLHEVHRRRFVRQRACGELADEDRATFHGVKTHKVNKPCEREISKPIFSSAAIELPGSPNRQERAEDES